MRIILTHEQADFDALASLLAAYLTDPDSTPVLPRRMNRNVRAFLTLYGAEFPFIDQNELNGEPISAVTLVDTQAMVTVRGLVPNPTVRVIDHHPRRESLSPEWEVWIVEIGATTTVLTETLQEHNSGLTPMQATLLMLGIYEDTGALTYTRTSPRDLLAASFLLAQGANLNILNDFLNHPLSKDQQVIYDQLRESVENIQVHGYSIMLAVGDAHGTDEELSSIAHKLRDLYDPAALFLLVQTRSGVQMIARSNTDHIDVGEISMEFGGGGHERAAAALIRDRDLLDTRAELVEMLPVFIRPAVTVSQIMSRIPQLLAPETNAQEAARRMRLYGYEGYPVVDDGKVIGLLTRRAVDRAIAHKLNYTALQLMEAGQITVSADDSIEQLQDRMISSGWGQIPVVDPNTQAIIGIVTRTDLLKTLPGKSRTSAHQNLATRLEAALPPVRLQLLKAVVKVASEHGAALYVVGGFVRDLLLDRPSLDFDLVVEGDAIQLAHAIGRQYGGRITSHARFGTAKWHTGELREALIERLTLAEPGENQKEVHANDIPDSLDLVTARTEFYTFPTALPTVERGSIKLDLHRRDFTINTLAIRLDGEHYGELHDYWGGLNDLRQKKVRVLHSLSFIDDPTRLLRAVRFEQRFGFQIEIRTLELMTQALPLLERISGDRIRHELDHMLIDPKVTSILARLNELNLLQTIHPKLTWDAWVETCLAKLQNQSPADYWELEPGSDQNHNRQAAAYIFWTVRLSRVEIASLAERLRLSAGLRRVLNSGRALWKQLTDLANQPISEQTIFLDEIPPLARYGVFLACEDGDSTRMLQQHAQKWTHIKASTDGETLRQRGLPPGPVYKEILGQLRSAWLDGKIHTPAEEEKLLEAILAKQTTPTRKTSAHQ